MRFPGVTANLILLEAWIPSEYFEHAATTMCDTTEDV